MRVGLDFRSAMRPTTGISRYVYGLSGALAANGCDVRLYGVFLRGNRALWRRPPPGARLLAWRFPARWMRALGRAGILTADRLLKCQVYHHTDYLLAEVASRTPEVMTIHDLAFLRSRAWHDAKAISAMTRVVERARERCAAFVVPSEATAADCRELLRLPSDRVFVTPLGIDASFFDLPAVPPGRAYLLAVGTLEPRKNHARLIRAFRAAGVAAELRIAGGNGWLFDDVTRAAAAASDVVLLGRLSERELRAQLAGATAVAYPSLHEGFGLPVLEAMAGGKAVLTSDREPLRGLVGDAALLVDPEDQDALVDAIRRLFSDEGLRRTLEARAPGRARRYTWEACAAATKRAYEAVLR